MWGREKTFVLREIYLGYYIFQGHLKVPGLIPPTGQYRWLLLRGFQSQLIYTRTQFQLELISNPNILAVGFVNSIGIWLDRVGFSFG